MHIIRGAEAPQFELPGIRFTGLAAPSRGSAEICAWQLTLAPGLDSPEAHVLDHDEIFIVASGGIRLGPEGEVAGPGDAVVVPAGEPIQVANPGSEPAEVVVMIRAGFRAKGADGTDMGTPPWAM
jgi:uncharacterized RmlC-like cupin family protein